MKPTLTLIFLFTSFLFYGQTIVNPKTDNALYVNPNSIIAFTWGYHTSCDLNTWTQLHINDSTVIKFNESSTFEVRLNCNKANFRA